LEAALKFSAILRDSVREALDAKVIYVLLALSAVVIVAMSSVSFKAEGPEKGLETILSRLPGAQGGFGTKPPVQYKFENLDPIGDPNKPWEGRYRFDLVATETPIQPAEEEGEEGEDKDKDKGKGAEKPPPLDQPSIFRIVVLLTDFETRDEAELTDEDRQTRKRLQGLFVQMLMLGPNPNRAKAKKLNDQFNQEIKKVTPGQMERFVKSQLAAQGTMDAKVKYLDESERTFRFAVESQARGADTARTWPHRLGILFGAFTLPVDVSVGGTVFLVEDWLVGGLGAAVALLFSIVVTAFFIPNMLRKGTIDLLLAKPIHRSSLLLCKYVGGLSFMVLTTVATVLGLWVILGIRSGLWPTGFLVSIGVLVLQFALFYAVSTLLGVLTRSPIVSILGAVAAWGILLVLSVALSILKPFHDANQLPKWVYPAVDTVRLVLPRYKDLDALNSRWLAQDLMPADSMQRREAEKRAEKLRWYESLGVTGVYIVVLLGLACWRFAAKDY
jgi:ABC-type transport system involved in multi-copper enzyme maturation permease subunit